MVLSACGGSDDNGGEGGGGKSGGTFSAYISEPKSPLVPGNTTESEGAKVIAALWTGLVGYSEDGEVEYSGVADSIESEDNQNWTIKLKDGWTFHDGTPVDAESFVNAWNYTANPQNAQDGGSYLSRIAGYDELEAGTATELSGLKVEDDQTFTVELKAPFALFPAVVGYDAFNPLPKAFFDDPEGFGTKPIGNGPFQADGEFVPGQGIKVKRFEDYAGEDKAKADGIDFVVYADQATAYTDAQDGNVDIVDVIPPDVIESAKDEFGDGFINTEVSQITYLGFPTYDARFQDPRVRQAISMAIDRDAISKAIFSGTRTAADSFVSPAVDGYREGSCAYCELDVDKANALLDEAGFDRSKPVELWFNAGAGHDAWLEAVGNQLRQNLDVDFQLKGDLDFSQYLPLGENKGFTGPFRYGWSFDYPAAESYLTPLFTPQSFPPTGSNYSFYSNEKVVDLIAEGDKAESEDEAIKAYQQAEDLIAEDMPMAPLFFTQIQTVATDHVSNVRIDLFQRPVWSEVTVND
ncbi:ABC transporter substrate-binding protein [Blastococcus sp. TF02-8]|nr:ABC transporter substrate-binding protein [Blastococcus sp. TF02-8]